MTHLLKTTAGPHPRETTHGNSGRFVALLLVTLGLLLAFGISSASAKEVVAYFGTESGKGTLGGQFGFPTDSAVNTSGAGPANKGDIYVGDGRNFDNRVQRFAQNDNGTPGDPYDDKFEFVSAWGGDVDATPSGGSDYEICTVAADCKAGVISAGNGTAAGNGSFDSPSGIAVDQETGNVYVLEGGSFRVGVYSGDGTFLRSFGWDVVESGPDNAGTGYEICVAANGDICKTGVRGSGIGQIDNQGFGESIAISPPDGNPATGTVFVSDNSNTRIDTYDLGGTNPGSFGSFADFGEYSPTQVAVDSRGIVYASSRKNKGEIERYDTENANGGGIGFIAPIAAPPLLLGPSGDGSTTGLKIDPDSDGAGPDTDVLYVVRFGFAGITVVQQFGPLNAPGLTAPPAADDAEHGTLVNDSFASGLANGLSLDESNGRLFISSTTGIGGEPEKSGVYVLDEAGGLPTATLDSLSGVTPTTVTAHATIDPNGPPPVSYHLEYSTDGSNWIKTGEVVVGTQEDPQAIEAVLDPPGTGLEPDTFYHVRLVATKAFTPPITTSELTFTTLADTPEVETVGAPIRTTTTAQLGGRVNPRNATTTYHFEYGDQGPCDSNPCSSTLGQPAGSGLITELVSEEIEGLSPGAVYHYRLVADNGNPGSPVFGEDMTVTTRASEAPLSHGRFAGPPGSDRAYEQLNAPDTGGNPVEGAAVISDNGSRAIYGIAGGTSTSTTGAFNQFFAERTASGWRTRDIYPARDQIPATNWFAPLGRSDLASYFALNHPGSLPLDTTMFRLSPEGPPQNLHQAIPAEGSSGPFIASDNGSTVVMGLVGAPDPAHPSVSGQHLYEIGSGSPHLVDLLPDGVSSCGLSGAIIATIPRTTHWISADGRFVFFPSRPAGCSGNNQLYVRDLSSSETKLISGPTVSGSSCEAALVKSTPDAAFFWTQSRLVSEDTLPASCSGPLGGDIYRYGLGDGSLVCVTCIGGTNADISANVSADLANARTSGAVAEDGSRVYFQSPNRLLPGALPNDVYRVTVESGDLVDVGSVGKFSADEVSNGNALTPDGSVYVFRSSSAGLNPLGGAGNGGTAQYYRYDDDDRSLVCVSCPQDGSQPASAVSSNAPYGQGPNETPLSADGETFAFSTPSPLVGADQNTSGPGHDPLGGTDAYEWRDGRLLLISDGLTNWPASDAVPAVRGMNPSGKDIIFTAAIQYTPDALDDYKRLYDARIGGGFEFPASPPPCPLEVCQGTPKGAPEEAQPGTSAFSGPGNAQPARKHKKRHHKARHHKKAKKQAAKHRANHDRRAAR